MGAHRRLIGRDGKIDQKMVEGNDHGKRWEIDRIEWKCNLDYTGI